MRKAIATTASIGLSLLLMGALSFGAREAWATDHPLGNAEHAKKMFLCNPDDGSRDCAQIGTQGRCIVGACFCNPG